MRQIAEGVFEVAIEFEYGDRRETIHPAAVETDRGLVLVDVGYPGRADDLAAELGERGFTFDDVALVLVTHQDGDHAGALRAVRDRTSAPVLAHRAAAPFVDGRRKPIKGDGERYPPAPVDVELVDGVVLRTVAGEMHVVFTPGHAPGHVALYLPDEHLLLAADALTARDGVLDGPSERYTPDLAEAGRSVERLADLDVERVLCYHGGLVEVEGGRLAEIAAGLTG